MFSCYFGIPFTRVILLFNTFGYHFYLPDTIRHILLMVNKTVKDAILGISMLEFFLTTHSYVNELRASPSTSFYFHLWVGVPSTNVKKYKNQRSYLFDFKFRYADNCLSIRSPNFSGWLPLIMFIYPPELEINRHQQTQLSLLLLFQTFTSNLTKAVILVP